MSVYTCVSTNKFEKDLKRARKRHKPMKKLAIVIESLTQDIPLPASNRPHKLSGEWADCFECHIEPDWLLIYRYDKSELQLIRTGTHSDLFP